MSPSNNPADRLADILDELRGQPSADSVRAGFARVLGTESDAEFGAAFGFVQLMPALIEQLVRAHADEHDPLELLLRWRPNVEQILITAWNLNAALQTVLNVYEPGQVEALRHCGTVLKRARVEPQVSQEQFDDWWKQIEELYSDLRDAENVPADLRSFILDQLDKIRVALREYKVRGADSLRDVVERVIGSGVLHQEIVTPADEQSKSWLQKLWGIVAGVGVAANVASKLLQLPGGVEGAQTAIEHLLSLPPGVG